MSKGLVYIFTGNGKGKTSAAIGTAVRAAGAGMRVAWVGFYKQESWGLSELKPLRSLGVGVYLLGKGFKIQETGDGSQKSGVKMAKVGKGGVVVDTASEEEHKAAAQATLEKARELVGEVEVLIMDEVNNAVSDGLIPVKAVQTVLEGRGKTHVVLTGRSAIDELIEVADLVTEMGKVKHPYDEGELAVKGLDF